MSSIKRNLEILDVIASMGSCTRMEVFNAFDGTMSWPEMKRRISFLHADGVVETHPGNSPDKADSLRLTKNGEKVCKDFGFSEDETTESMEE